MPPKAMKKPSTKKWKFLPKHHEVASQAQALDDAAADDAPADEEEQTKQKQWEVVPIEAFFRNGRVKFKYIWLEKEPEP